MTSACTEVSATLGDPCIWHPQTPRNIRESFFRCEKNTLNIIMGTIFRERGEVFSGTLEHFRPLQLLITSLVLLFCLCFSPALTCKQPQGGSRQFSFAFPNRALLVHSAGSKTTKTNKQKTTFAELLSYFGSLGENLKHCRKEAMQRYLKYLLSGGRNIKQQFLYCPKCLGYRYWWLCTALTPFHG